MHWTLQFNINDGSLDYTAVIGEPQVALHRVAYIFLRDSLNNYLILPSLPPSSSSSALRFLYLLRSPTSSTASLAIQFPFRPQSPLPSASSYALPPALVSATSTTLRLSFHPFSRRMTSNHWFFPFQHFLHQPQKKEQREQGLRLSPP